VIYIVLNMIYTVLLQFYLVVCCGDLPTRWHIGILFVSNTFICICVDLLVIDLHCTYMIEFDAEE